MNTRIYLLTFFVALNLLFASLSEAAELVVGYEQNPPMASTAAGGKAHGIMIDLLEEVARREGWKIKYAPCVWNSCLQELEAGRLDLLLAIAYTPERAQRFNYNQHTVITNWGLLYSRPSQRIEKYTDLDGKRIAVVKNDVYGNTLLDMLQKFNIKCDLVFADNFREIFGMIERGEVDAGAANRIFSVLNERSFKIKSTPVIFSPVSVQVAAPKSADPAILAVFDRHLEAMKKDRGSVYHQSLERWLGIEGRSASLPDWFWWIAGGFSGTGLVLIAFVAMLKREVRRKTADLFYEVAERRKSEEQLRMVLDNMQEIFLQTDPEGVIRFVSNGIGLFGYRADDLKGSNFRLLYKNEKDFNLLVERLKRDNTVTGMRSVLLMSDNTERVVALNARLIPDENGNPEYIVCSGTDVTEQLRMEGIMAQTEKMMMVGGLAAGMAHEINNPLGIIMQHVQNIQRRISPDLPANREAALTLGIDLNHLREYMEYRGILKFMHQIQEAGERMARIVANMLKFSRKSESRIESARLDLVIDQAIELAASDYDLKKHYDFKKIDIVKEFDPDLPKVPLTVLEIEQVLLNLLKNAAQAMSENTGTGQPRIIIRTFTEDDNAVIEIEDNGPGMSKEVQKRIFDPFFTTKDVGVGTGLGLSVSYAIITNNHHGRLEVDSGPGSGTRFSVILPMTYRPVSILNEVEP